MKKILSLILSLVMLAGSFTMAPQLFDDNATTIIEAQAATKVTLKDKKAEKALKKLQYIYTKDVLNYYAKGSFSSVSNNLKLRSTWNYVYYNNLTVFKQYPNYFTETISAKDMKKAVQYIYGPSATIKNESFKDLFQMDVTFKNNKYVYKCDGGIGNGPEPFIYQELDKIEKSGDYLKFYVKAVYAEQDWSNDTTILYKNYDGKKDKGSKKLGSINEILNDTSEISTTHNKKIKKYYRRMPTYVYTFKLDKDGNYYLNGFSK